MLEGPHIVVHSRANGNVIFPDQLVGHLKRLSHMVDVLAADFTANGQRIKLGETHIVVPFRANTKNEIASTPD